MSLRIGTCTINENEFSNGATSSLVVFGKVATLHLNGDLANTKSHWSDTKIATVTPAPYSLVGCLTNSNGYDLRYIQINSNGDVVLRTLEKPIANTGFQVRFTITYITA